MNQQKQRSQNKVNYLALYIPRSSNGRTRRFERWNGGSNPSLGELNDTRAGFRSALVPYMHI